MHVTQTRSLGATRQVGYGALAVALLAFAVFELVRNGTGWWQFFALGAAPDIALFVGIAPGLANGRLHPRAVPLYNALHRFWGPLALGALAAFGIVSLGFFVGAIAWALHIAVDRTAGYDLRTPDGLQRI